MSSASSWLRCRTSACLRRTLIPSALQTSLLSSLSAALSAQSVPERLACWCARLGAYQSTFTKRTSGLALQSWQNCSSPGEVSVAGSVKGVHSKRAGGWWHALTDSYLWKKSSAGMAPLSIEVNHHQFVTCSRLLRSRCSVCCWSVLQTLYGTPVSSRYLQRGACSPAHRSQQLCAPSDSKSRLSCQRTPGCRGHPFSTTFLLRELQDQI